MQVLTVNQKYRQRRIYIMKPIQIVLLIFILNILNTSISHAVDMELNYDFKNIYNLQDKKNEAIRSVENNNCKSNEAYHKHFVLGILYLPENPNKAKEEFKEVLRLKPDNTMSYLNLGYLTLNSNIEESINYFKSALKYDQAIAETYNALAVAYMSQNNMLESINILEKGLEVIGKEESLYFNQSLILSKYFANTKEGDKIVRNMSNAINMNPREEYFMVLGNYYLRKKEHSAALKIFSKAVEKYPKSIYCILGLATSYKDINEYDRAISIAKKALEISPDNKLILDEIKEYEEAYKAFTDKVGGKSRGQD